MRRFLTFFAIAALVVWGLLQTRTTRTQAPRALWKKQSDGLETLVLRRRTGVAQVTITAIRADASRVHVATGALLEVPDWARKTGARAVINGGYFDSSNRPLGLRVASGWRTHPLRTANWGVFYIRDNRAQIKHTRDYRPSKQTQEAIQCGPRLVVAGKTTDLKPQWARRSGVGIDAQNRVILAVSDGELSFDEWAKLWASPQDLSCPNALNLDGGGSTQMWSRADSKARVAGAWAVPDVLVVK